MRQFAAILIAFALMPLWNKKKLGFGPTLLITGLILSAIAGLSAQTVLDSAVRVVTTASTVQTIIVVLLVGVLGNLLKTYGILDIIVDSLKQLISSKKAIIMVLPAVMGLLSVPGGAYLSAPFVDSIGGEIGMKPEGRAVVNLSYRHIAMFLMPFTSSMIFIPTVIPQVNIYSLIALNLGFVVVMQLGSYFMYLRGIPAQKSQPTGSRAQAVKNLLIYLSPIYMVVVFNAVFNIPMYISTALCVALTFLLRPKKDFLKVALGGVSVSTMTMLMGVYFVQNIIKNLDEVMATFSQLFQNSAGITVLLTISCAAVLFGITTGLSLVPMGIILPLVAALSISPEQMLVYTFFVFVWSFLGYYFSPLHLCQLLTVKYIGCSTGAVYREHAKLFPYLAVASYLLFYLYSMILL